MPDWSVNIVSTASGDAAIVVDLPGYKQGDPLQAEQEDIVSWYNQTEDVHQLWQTDANYSPLDAASMTGPIPAGQSSDGYPCVQPVTSPPGGSQQGWTVYYYCNRHPDNPRERGSIVLTALPTNSVNILSSATETNFAPQARGANSGDLINWNNLTQEAHQPWPTDANYQPLPVKPGSPDYLSGVIPAGGTSQIYAVVPPANTPTATRWTVYYFCNLHPDEESERGTIVVPPPPIS
jgi:plastocyanin